jgi:CheY-like chemotaxis protein
LDRALSQVKGGGDGPDSSPEKVSSGIRRRIRVVLVVGDDERTRQLLAEPFRRGRYLVESSSDSAQQACAMAQRFAPDVVVVEHEANDTLGADVVREIALLDGEAHSPVVLTVLRSPADPSGRRCVTIAGWPRVPREIGEFVGMVVEAMGGIRSAGEL